MDIAHSYKIPNQPTKKEAHYVGGGNIISRDITLLIKLSKFQQNVTAYEEIGMCM